MKRMGFSLSTVTAPSTPATPSTTSWGQWMFLKMLGEGPRPTAARPRCNWCPVLQDGACQRAGRSRAAAGAAARCPRSASSPSGTSRSPTTPRSSWTTSTSSSGWPEHVKAAAGATGSAAPRAPRLTSPLPARGRRQRPPTASITRLHHPRRHAFWRELLPVAARAARLPLSLWPATEHDLQAFMELEDCHRKVCVRRAARAPSARSTACFTGRYVRSTPSTGRSAPSLGRRLRPHGLRHRRRHGRAPAATSATSTSPRSIGLEICPDHPARRTTRSTSSSRTSRSSRSRPSTGTTPWTAEGYLVQSGEFTGMQ